MTKSPGSFSFFILGGGGLLRERVQVRLLDMENRRTGWIWTRMDSLASEISTGVDLMKNRALPLPLPGTTSSQARKDSQMKPLIPTVILAATILTGKGFGQTIQKARASAEQDLRSAIGELAELRLLIEREKIPLSKKVTDLEREAITKTTRNSTVICVCATTETQALSNSKRKCERTRINSNSASVCYRTTPEVGGEALPLPSRKFGKLK